MDERQLEKCAVDSFGFKQREFERLREEYFAYIDAFRESLRARPSKARVMKLMGAHRCDVYIMKALENDHQEGKVFDGYWRDLHLAFETRLMESLSIELPKMGREVFISAEAPEDVGKLDLLLISNGHDPITIRDCLMRKTIGVELKTGYSWSMEQVERYLWKVDSLILTRLATADAVVFRRQELMPFLTRSLSDKIAKVKRFLNGDLKPLPSNDCFECPIQNCQFNMTNQGKGPEFILVKKEHFHKTPELMNNLYIAIDRTIDLILEELDNCSRTK